MTIADAIILGITALVGGLIISYVSKKRAESQIKRELRSKVRVSEIMEMREQLKKLHKETTDAHKDYEKAKEDYAKRFKYTNSGSNPTSTDSKS